MSLIEAVRQNRLFLIHGAILTIQQCLDDLSKIGKKPQEPDYIAKFAMAGPQLLAKYWNPLLFKNAVTLDITGVYCHQKPKVRFNGMKCKSVEIGDLLWCHFHTFEDGHQSRNALLYQAKVTHKILHRFWRRNEHDQFTLYSEWPQFEYFQSPPFSGLRHIVPSAPRRGAEYLLIDNKTISPDPFYPCIPYLPLIPIRHFCCELVDSLEFLAGDLFDDRTVTNIVPRNDWSTVIWDLLENSLKCRFTRNIAGYHGTDIRNNTVRSTAHQPTEVMKLVLGEDDAQKLIQASVEAGTEAVDLSIQDDAYHGIPLIIVETKEERSRQG